MAYFGTEFKSAKIKAEGLKKHIQIVLCSKQLEKTPNIRKVTRLRKVVQMVILHLGYSRGKRPILGRNLKVPKSMQKESRNTLKLFYPKSGLKKRLMFEK